MKFKVLLLGFLTLSLIFCSSCNGPMVITETDVPDPALRQLLEFYTGKIIATEINKFPPNPVTLGDLARITGDIRTDGHNDGPVIETIVNLKGLELCDGADFLLLNRNDLNGPDANLSAIAQMNSLTQLDMVECSLQDLDFLLGMTSIFHLKIWNNPDIGIDGFMSITPTSFPNLSILGISGWDDDGDGETDTVMPDEWQLLLTLLAGHANLSNLAMRSFQMNDQMLEELYTDVLSVNHARWEWLNFPMNSLTEVSLALLVDLVNLQGFGVSGNSNFVDISWIIDMTGLRGANFDNTGITDITPLKTFYDNGDTDNKLVWFSIRDCPNLDLSDGTANKDALDYLLENGVWVGYDSL